MSLRDAAETLVHYIKHGCRDLSPDMLAELDMVVRQFEDADKQLADLKAVASILALMTGKQP